MTIHKPGMTYIMKTIKYQLADGIATITFDGGEGAAYESVYFQVEKASGAVVEYRRRANGDGVARLVLARRNTEIYVYAFSETSDESDTIKVRFR